MYAGRLLIFITNDGFIFITNDGFVFITIDGFTFGPAPVQMSGMLSRRRAVVIVCGSLQGLVVSSLTSRFLVNSHLDRSRAWIPACLLDADCYSDSMHIHCED